MSFWSEKMAWHVHFSVQLDCNDDFIFQSIHHSMKYKIAKVRCICIQVCQSPTLFFLQVHSPLSSSIQLQSKIQIFEDIFATFNTTFLPLLDSQFSSLKQRHIRNPISLILNAYKRKGIPDFFGIRNRNWYMYDDTIQSSFGFVSLQ